MVLRWCDLVTRFFERRLRGPGNTLSRARSVALTRWSLRPLHGANMLWRAATPIASANEHPDHIDYINQQGPSDYPEQNPIATWPQTGRQAGRVPAQQRGHRRAAEDAAVVGRRGDARSTRPGHSVTGPYEAVRRVSVAN